MLSLRDVITGLYGAWRLAHLDRAAFGFFDSSTEGALRSFFAAVLVAPLYATTLALALLARGAGADGGEAAAVDPWRFAVVETIAYVVSWLAYPLVVEWLTRTMDCRERFEGYLVAYNWSMVLQNLAILPLTILVTTGLLPLELGQFAWIAVLTLVLGWLWFIARAALGVAASTAAGLVLLDVLLSVGIDGVAAGMY